MTEPDPLQDQDSDTQELVWPPPVSSDDIVWLDPVAAKPLLDAPLDTSPDDAPRDASENALAAPQVPDALLHPTATTETPGALPLSFCLLPEVAFEWHDAVAIVQQLAEQLTRGLRSEPAGSLPDIGGITIDAAGGLSARLDPTAPGSLARGLGYLLHQLLVDRDRPVALRLIVAQVVSDLPTIGSVEELSRELAPWERPNRNQKLRRVYERLLPVASTRPQPVTPPPEVVEVRAETTVLQTPTDTPVTVTLADAAQAVRAWLVSHRTVAQSAAVFAFVMLIVAAGFIILPGRSRSPVAPPAVAPAPPVVESVSPAPDYWVPGRIEGRIAFPRSPVSSANPPRAPISSANPPARRTPTPAQPPSSDPVVAGFIAQPPREEPAPRTAREEPAPRTVPVPQAAQPDTRPRAAPPSNVAAPPSNLAPLEAPERIYTSNDPGVVEAVLVKPYLPEHPDPGTPPESLGVLELVVNRYGEVESVRLRSPFNRYRERWWVFVAKNWTFRPAFKDGQPVRSLKRIIITDVRLTDPQ